MVGGVRAPTGVFPASQQRPFVRIAVESVRVCAPAVEAGGPGTTAETLEAAGDGVGEGDREEEVESQIGHPGLTQNLSQDECSGRSLKPERRAAHGLDGPRHGVGRATAHSPQVVAKVSVEGEKRRMKRHQTGQQHDVARAEYGCRVFMSRQRLHPG